MSRHPEGGRAAPGADQPSAPPDAVAGVPVPPGTAAAPSPQPAPAPRAASGQTAAPGATAAGPAAGSATLAPEAAAPRSPDWRPRPALGYALYLAAALLFGLNGTVSKVLLVAVDDSARMSQLRVSFAFLILLLIVATTNPGALRVRRDELATLAAYGVIGVAMTQWLFFVAIERMPIGISLLIEFTAPIMVVLWVRFAWRRPVRNTIWLGLAMALVGLGMVAQVGGDTSLNPVGVAAAFGAATALAVYFLIGESAGQRRDPVSLTLWGFGFASLMWAVLLPWWSFPWDSLAGSATPLGEGSHAIPLWALASSMVVLGTIAPFWLVLASIRHIGAAGASIVGMLEPLLAAVVAWIVLGEVLTAVQVLGGIIVLGGVLVAERARG